MILLTGATGTVGSALLARLADRNVPFRALAHSPAGREAIERFGVEAVDGDFDRPDALEQAMAGCDRLFLLSPPHPDQPTREKAAIDTAKRVGVSHVVALSVMGADPASPVVFGRWHADVDEHLVGSGLAYTILRPAAFMQVHLLPVDTIKSQGRWYGMSGDGAAGYIDVDDIAAVAAEVLTGPGRASATLELSGPAAISLPQAAGVLSEVIGRRVEYVELPSDQFRANLAAAGLPDWLADGIVALYQAVRAGHAATVTNTVQDVLGRPARNYRQFAEARKGLFADA
ncbi:MAG TPA: SDR family oxidoreductase [Pseudonocardiaceae bacterium]